MAGDPVPCSQKSLRNHDEDEGGPCTGTPGCRALLLGEVPSTDPVEREGTGNVQRAEARTSFWRLGRVAPVLGHQHPSQRPSHGVCQARHLAGPRPGEEGPLEGEL